MIADFRAKTAELFHSLDGQSADDIDTFEYRDSVLNWNPSFQFASLSSDLANRLHK